MRHIVLGLLLLIAVPAQASDWGVFDEIANREWTSDKEPRPRVTKFRWIKPGKVLEARHGFTSRLQFGEAKFADTVQRFVLDSKTGKIDVTYTYEDGRPPLKAVIEIQDDGTAIESFTDKNGVKKRNIYKSPSLSNNAIERQEMKGGTWASLGTTKKSGLTQFEIAENKRRAEEARQRAIAQENARIAAERERERIEMARREAEERAYAQQQAQMQQQQQQQMYNPLDALNAIANSMRQSNSGGGYGGSYGGSSSGGGSSGGAIIVSDNSEEEARFRAEQERRDAEEAERLRRQAAESEARMAEDRRQEEERKANAKDCYGRPIGSGPSSSSSSSSSSGGSRVCPI